MTISIGHGWRPGVLGEVVAAFSTYVSRDWDFGPIFEAKIAREMAAFLDRYDPRRDRLFWADDDGDLLGSVTIDVSDPDLRIGETHLRWFVVKEAARLRGIGKLLLNEAMVYLAQAGFQSCYLTTGLGLTVARHLYEKAGFRLVHEYESTAWGPPIIEQRFAVDLNAGRKTRR